MTICNELTREDTLGIDPALVMKAVVKGMGRYETRFNDAISSCIGEAIRTYNPERKASQKTWVFNYLRWKIQLFVEKQIGTENDMSLDHVDPNTETTMHETVASEHNTETAAINNVTHEEHKGLIAAALTRMDEKGRFAINFIMGELDNGNERYGSALGDAMVAAGLIKKTGDNNNNREIGRKTAAKYLEKLRNLIVEIKNNK
jgi:hypothetical protein